VLPAVERSRSGDGAHIWFFFSAPVPAALARRFGLMLLTDAMGRCSTLGMASYDRLFPSQDMLPKGGFGNLIALPLQYEARRHGNSLFVNEQLVPRTRFRPDTRGHSIRPRRSACRESRRPVWMERQRMSSALSSEP
jgi:hypothetical protein